MPRKPRQQARLFCATCGVALSPDAFGLPPRAWRGQQRCDRCIASDLCGEAATDAAEIAALAALGVLSPGEADSLERGAVAGGATRYLQPVFEER